MDKERRTGSGRRTSRDRRKFRADAERKADRRWAERRLLFGRRERDNDVSRLFDASWDRDDISVDEELAIREFENLQLNAHMVFCRACGLMKNKAVPMYHRQILHLDFLHHGAVAGIYHVYACSRCGHRAMSEQH